jgi:hypothetical protein
MSHSASETVGVTSNPSPTKKKKKKQQQLEENKSTF